MMPSYASPVKTGSFEITFPAENGGADQDCECCDVVLEDGPRRIRFHDYAEIYAVPGLYEQLFYEKLRCQSPSQVCRLLADELVRANVDPSDLRVLDLGAGNGMVAERLYALGVSTLVGVDILPEAAEAAERDRPGIYDDYVVADLTALDGEDRETLTAARFNCLTSVAALGFGDIPPTAFATAFDLVEDGGWIALSIKETFLRDGEGSGFARLVGAAIDTGALEVLDRRPYRHRLAASGDPLRYVALVGRKRAPAPAVT
jgi:SAM-dependent methyltransferase